MIKVENVSMRFRKGNDNITSLKEFAIAKAKKKIEYTDFWVFKDVSFEVSKGDVVGIIGRNGAGKSTILKIISGILAPTEGKVTLGGKIVPMLELGSGFDFDLSGRENIFLNGAILGYSEEFLTEKYDEIVEFSELEEFIESPIRNYSSGMLMKLAFSIATIVEPEILIVDEILAVGDEHFQKKSKRKMLELMGGGTTVLFVSHSLDQIREMCNKVIWLEKGKLKMQGETKLVCDLYYEYMNPDSERKDKKHKASDAPKNLSDVLFVYGDDEKAYERRVTYQREQLLVGMVASNEIYYKDITDSIAKLYRSFVCVNCPKTEKMISFIRCVVSYKKKIYFDFSGCLEMGTKDVQYELFDEFETICNSIIASNETIANYFRKRGCNVFVNKVTIEEKLHEYANWANYDRDILPNLDPLTLNEDELINYNRACSTKKDRENDGFRIGYFVGRLKGRKFDTIKDVLIKLLAKNVKLFVNDKEQFVPSSYKLYANQIVFTNAAEQLDVIRMFSGVDVIIYPVENYYEEQDEMRFVLLLAALVNVPCIVYAKEKIALEIGYMCTNLMEVEKCILRLQAGEFKQLHLMDWCNCNDSFETGISLSNYIRSNMTSNIVFLIQKDEVNDRTKLACYYAMIMKKNDWDVTILVRGEKSENIVIEGVELPVVSRDVTYTYQYFDRMVAFDWESVAWMQNYGNVAARSYVVQGDETQEMQKGNLDRFKAIQMLTPHTKVDYYVVSEDTKMWLKEKYYVDAKMISSDMLKECLENTI